MLKTHLLQSVEEVGDPKVGISKDLGLEVNQRLSVVLQYEVESRGERLHVQAMQRNVGAVITW